MSSSVFKAAAGVGGGGSGGEWQRGIAAVDGEDAEKLRRIHVMNGIGSGSGSGTPVGSDTETANGKGRNLCVCVPNRQL